MNLVAAAGFADDFSDLLAGPRHVKAERLGGHLQALQMLVSEAEMGELFKVIAYGRGIDFTLAGFSRGDRGYSL